MLKEVTKEAICEASKKVLKDGVDTLSAGVYAGFIVSSAYTGLKLGLTGWNNVYTGIIRGVKNLISYLKNLKKTEAEASEDNKPEDSQPQEK